MLPRSRSNFPLLSKNILEALLEIPLPLQCAFLRKHLGITQESIAKQLKIKQTFISALESDGRDHLLSHYEKLVQILGCKLAVVPRSTQLIPKKIRGSGFVAHCPRNSRILNKS